MRWALIGEDRTPFVGGIHPVHHHRHAAGQAVNRIRLRRHNIGQIINRADQMRHPLLHRFNFIGHNPILAAPFPIRYTANR